MGSGRAGRATRDAIAAVAKPVVVTEAVVSVVTLVVTVCLWLTDHRVPVPWLLLAVAVELLASLGWAYYRLFGKWEDAAATVEQMGSNSSVGASGNRFRNVQSFGNMRAGFFIDPSANVDIDGAQAWGNLGPGFALGAEDRPEGYETED